MRKTLLFLAMLCFLGFVGTAAAVTYTEVGDAGDTLATARNLPGGVDRIAGNTPIFEVDLYRFYWNGGNFYVNSVGTEYDPQLFLFSATGQGIQANDDGIAYAGPAYLQLSTLDSGYYFLGISWYDVDPYDGAGQLMFETYPFEPLYGPLNAGPLSYWYDPYPWTPDFAVTGDYIINFSTTSGTGQLGDTNPTGPPPGTTVPEPGTFMLLGGGVAALCVYGRSITKK